MSCAITAKTSTCLVEAQADLRAAAPGDDAVERHAVHQLELEPLADRDLVIDMEDGAAGAELADRADLADAARGDRARPQGVAVRLLEPGIEPRHVAGQGIDYFHAHASNIERRTASGPACAFSSPEVYDFLTASRPPLETIAPTKHLHRPDASL